MSNKKHTNINSLAESARGKFERIDVNNLNPPKKKKKPRNSKPTEEPYKYSCCTGMYDGPISG